MISRTVETGRKEKDCFNRSERSATLSANLSPIHVSMKERLRKGNSKTVVIKSNLRSSRKRKIGWSEEKQDNDYLVLPEDALI